MTNSTLVATALRILREPGVSKIGFTLNGLTVTGMGYSMVAKAIADGSIGCETVATFTSQGKQELAKGMVTEARYEIDRNTMLFPREDYGQSWGQEALTIFHESTHAIFDLFARSKNTRTLAIDDESAAVLAEALYIRLCDKPPKGFAMVIDGPQYEALKLADSLMAETGKFVDDPRTYPLKADQIADLRAAVATDWNFVRKVEPGGVIDDRRTAQYIYNGVVKCYSRWAQGN